MQAATFQDIPEIDALFCSQAEAIELEPHVCTEENRSNRLTTWLEPAIRKGFVWVIRTENRLDGFMVLNGPCDSEGETFVEKIDYIVVAEHMQGHHRIGPDFVQHAIKLAFANGEIEAEARNERSKKLLKKAGFYEIEQVGAGHTRMKWSANPAA